MEGESLRRGFAAPPPFHKGGDRERSCLRHFGPLVKGGCPRERTGGFPSDVGKAGNHRGPMAAGGAYPDRDWTDESLDCSGTGPKDPVLGDPFETSDGLAIGLGEGPVEYGYACRFPATGAACPRESPVPGRIRPAGGRLGIPGCFAGRYAGGCA